MHTERGVKHGISDIGIIRSEFNISDCMNKIMHPKLLMEVMRTWVLDHPVDLFSISKTLDFVWVIHAFENR